MQYTSLGKLYVYQQSIDLCDLSWEIFESLSWQDKKIIGDQFIRSIDSNAANIAEGYGRYHYLDKIKFYYNARASLLEAKHWMFLLFKRKKITEQKFQETLKKADHIHYTLNKFIQSCYKAKKDY